MNKDNQSDAPPQPASLVEVRRGSITESRHRGFIVAVTGEGEEIARLGAGEVLTYLRSSAKPHQAIPLVATGAADRFNFTPAEIAVACGSHSGETVHTEMVAAMLAKIKLTKDALHCGTHEPFDKNVARELRANCIEPDVLQNNCSGKHTGMIALALHLNAPVETYERPENPVQKQIAETIAQFSDVALEDIAVGTDGCGVPVFGVTVSRMALMYARLVAPPADFDKQTRDACARIVKAMTAHPEMVGGTTERLDTELMRATNGAVISKVGAEGVYTAGVLPSSRFPHGLGLAIKIEDGEDRRARPTVVIESLRQLGVLDEKALTKLTPYASFPIKNNLRETVGQVTPKFNLKIAVSK